jgi:hypothetical protein
LSFETITAIQELAKKDSRSFSKMVEILLEKQLSEKSELVSKNQHESQS